MMMIENKSDILRIKSALTKRADDLAELAVMCGPAEDTLRAILAEEIPRLRALAEVCEDAFNASPASIGKCPACGSVIS